MGKPQPKREHKTVIEPSMRFVGDDEHILETIFKGNPDDMPEVKSIGYMRLPKGKFVSYVLTSKGDKIINFYVEEPTTQVVAEESAKISFAREFMHGDM